VCSGIEAASVAWHSLGWTPVGFSEIEPFPCAVLAHHFPKVTNYGDMSKFRDWSIRAGDIDLLVGGTPCQSFSVAGLRQGLNDPRGNLMLTFLAIAEHLKPKWILWENVPGVLSSNGGRDFASFLGALGQLGYGFAYRVLDAQWCRTHGHPRAVPQRRRRVFVVGCLGDQRSAAKVLFESESLQRYSAKGKATRQGTSADVEEGVGSDDDNRLLGSNIVGSLNTSDAKMIGTQYVNENKCVVELFVKTKIAQSSTDDEGWVEAGVGSGCDGGVPSSRGEHLVFNESKPVYCGSDTNASDTVTSKWQKQSGGPAGSECGLFVLQPFDQQRIGVYGTGEVGSAVVGQVHWRTTNNDAGQVSQTLKTDLAHQSGPCLAVAPTMQVRRLTPTECERLQGFPDGWTAIPWKKKLADDCPDGPRYKALGNSMAVNCMEWIGQRINAIQTQS